jgi:UDP-N-acetylglucosamine 2-epimerase (non-hydrolysing)
MIKIPKHIIHLVMAARPNIMKISPLYHALKATSWANPVLVHTGQHYDDNMSGVFLRTLNLPSSDHYLSIGKGSHAEQTGNTMISYEKLCQQKRPDMIIVVGDVNSTLACALAAKKLDIIVGHMEAGLRSFDRTMPEEINRLATDSICDWLWSPSPDATEQLLREGVNSSRIREVGNVMIDAYCMMEKQIKDDNTRNSLGLENKQYGVITFHRPVNVDNQEQLNILVKNIEQISSKLQLVFPIHPRTREKLIEFNLFKRLETCKGVILCEALPYINFMNLVVGARVVITDSGGVQEETTYLGIPCLTLRSSTERPITITHGTNQLVSPQTVEEKTLNILYSPLLTPPKIPGWDGQAAIRTVQHIQEIMNDF